MGPPAAFYADILDDAGALHLSAHILRHTLATNLLRAGVDTVVAELLGHTSYPR
ncbi:tyrosine-type recombinase/integrase [Nonomuraea sp. NPDC003201]